MTAVQLDLFADLDPEPEGLPLCLRWSAARGPAARMAEFRDWQRQHGSFGSAIRAHAWTLPMGAAPEAPSARCQAAALSVDLRAHPGAGDLGLACACTEADVFMHRGACRRCAWEGPERPGLGSENLAAEDALDHAWPGWRDLPVVERKPGNPKAQPAWLERVTAQYPSGWLEAGGPLRTWRRPLSSRHVPGMGPWGGYDMGVAEAVVSEAA